ncbi:MAG TPA: FecR domain-containing protein, partial [Pyrinomonadaceae bacterium]|nr:FecR domain-containing protein [Pyrinomonadaceae bacterium]
MRSTRHLDITLFSLLLTFAIPIAALAQDDDAEDYDVKARVVRMSLITGEVSLKRNGNTDWERARVNFPLVEGDTVATGRDSRLEIQVDARNFVRLGPNSMLRVATLRDEGIALSVVEGTASVRLAKFDRDKEYFEVDAPKVTLAAEKKGLYRIDVSRDGRVRLTARDGGRARIYSETSGFALRDGRTAELIIDGADAGDWQFLVAERNDSWDTWVDDRERYLAQRLRYDTQYYDNYIWGAEDLD